MSTVFVYSAAAGANNGTSWTDAYTSLASTNAAAAGDIVKIEYRHTQTGLAANINWSNGTTANPVRIVSCDKDNSDAPRIGAQVEWTTTGLGPQGNVWCYGVNWKMTGAVLTLTGGTDGLQTHDTCTFTCTGATGVTLAGTRPTHIWRNVTLDFSGASASTVGMNFTNAMRFEWTGGTYTTRSTQTSLLLGSAFSGSFGFILRGLNITGTVTNLVAGASTLSGWVVFSGCVMPAYTNVSGTLGINSSWRISIDGCTSGTITTAPLPPTLQTLREGTVAASLARYRTSGADDGSQANAYSWEVISNANAGPLTTPLALPTITRWVAAGAQSLTMYVASGVTLTDSEFWLEVLSQSEAGSATTQTRYQSTRTAPLATASNLTTDGTSTWNGTGVGTKQKVSVSITPTVAGFITIKPYYAKASTTIYIDPEIDINGDVAGKSRFNENTQFQEGVGSVGISTGRRGNKLGVFRI